MMKRTAGSLLATIHINTNTASIQSPSFAPYLGSVILSIYELASCTTLHRLRIARLRSIKMLLLTFLITVVLLPSAFAKPHPSTVRQLLHGKKAGLSGYIGIQNTPAFRTLAPHIIYYSDYTPNTPSSHGVKGIGMLWGASGSACSSVFEDRLQTFKSMIAKGKVPDVMFGFYEPDCSCPYSSEMSVASAAQDWNKLLAPLAKKGTLLGSPSMCKQYDEDFLTPFKNQISHGWDVTSIHINKPNVSEARNDVEYYVQKYKKPVWVSEFACVHDQPSWEPCTDQGEIDGLIRDVVAYFEANDNVVAYGPSNGAGLGDVWPLINGDGALTATGRTYLDAIKGL